ncbi:MAG: hypothetical protein AAB217_25375 [Chloroflexota bacterium]
MNRRLLEMERTTTLTEIALEKAQTILGSECSPIGLMASLEGYPHVWARDSVITSLGALLSPGHETCPRRNAQPVTRQREARARRQNPMR